jgi:hypothetical protein
MFGLIAGSMTLFAGVIFVAEESAFTGFYEITLILVFLTNWWFIVSWFYLWMCSLNVKNSNFQVALKIYSLLVCKEYKSVKIEKAIASKDKVKRNLKVEEEEESSTKSLDIKKKLIKGKKVSINILKS